MKDRCCGNCDFWEPTEIQVIADWPHAQRQAEREAEHHQLCTWDGGEDFISAMLKAPTWMTKAILGGRLTHEDDGETCPAWRHVR